MFRYIYDSFFTSENGEFPEEEFTTATANLIEKNNLQNCSYQTEQAIADGGESSGQVAVSEAHDGLATIYIDEARRENLELEVAGPSDENVSSSPISIPTSSKVESRVETMNKPPPKDTKFAKKNLKRDKTEEMRGGIVEVNPGEQKLARGYGKSRGEIGMSSWFSNAVSKNKQVSLSYEDSPVDLPIKEILKAKLSALLSQIDESQTQASDTSLAAANTEKSSSTHVKSLWVLKDISSTEFSITQEHQVSAESSEAISKTNVSEQKTITDENDTTTALIEQKTPATAPDANNSNPWSVLFVSNESSNHGSQEAGLSSEKFLDQAKSSLVSSKVNDVDKSDKSLPKNSIKKPDEKGGNRDATSTTPVTKKRKGKNESE